MSSQSLHLAKPSLAFAKIVATPTDTSWSQVYNAGNIFACLSLSAEQPEDGEALSLQTIGREVINILEAEFFGLEEKNIPTIKQAITTCVEGVPEGVKVNLCLAFFKDSVLYLFLYGAGKVVMKRGANVGILLEHKESSHHTIHTASGYIQNDDIIVLQTKEFVEVISDATLGSALELELPSDIVEALTPQIHQKENGGPAAMVVAYHGLSHAPAATPQPHHPATHEIGDEPLQASHYHNRPEPEFLREKEEPELDEAEEENDEEEVEEEENRKRRPSFKLPGIKLPHLALPRRKVLGIVIFLILIVLLVAGIMMHKQQQQTAQSSKLFESVYNPAQQKYDEGKELKTLNKDLSQKDFQASAQMIRDNLNKFPDGSSEKKKLTDLLALDQAELGGNAADNTPSGNVDKSKLSLAVLNGSGVPGAAKGTAAALASAGYTVASTGNADAYTYTGITIVTKKDFSNYQAQLKKDLAANNASAKITTKVDDSINTDAQVIVGK